MKNIVLTGFMGTGKTTVGKLLAKKLNRTFFDTDDMIEKQLSASISDIFKSVGEKQFREYESHVIKLMSSMDSCVIACGGGVVLDKNHIDLLRKNGIIINLFASPKQILDRIACQDHRPLIKKLLNPLEGVKKLMDQRKAAYSNCDIAVFTDGVTPEQVIITMLNNEDIRKILSLTKQDVNEN
jgi:shikimate kinase